MYLSIANRSTMCSTLIIGGLTSFELKSFVKSLKGCVDEYNSKEEEYYYRDHLASQEPSTVDKYDRELFPCLKAGRKVLDGYKVENFAFVMATTQAYQNHKMAEFGFKEVSKTYNSKNSTTVTLWMMTVSDFLAELAKYDAEGNLVNKEEVDIECAA